MEFIKTAKMTKEDWLRERRKSIGGSDMGAILGINDFESSYSVWAKKRGLIPDVEDNEAMRQGRDLEEYVAQRFTEKSGLKVHRENVLARNEKYPHLHANIDRKVVGMSAGLECKTASALSTKYYRGGEFPERYYAQCVVYMAVMEYERYYLAVVILGKAFKIYQLTRIANDECPDWCEASVYVSDEEFSALRQIAIEFWEENVEKNIPPATDGKKATTEAINTIYAESNGGQIELIGANKVIDTYRELEAEIKLLEAQKEALKQGMTEDLGENESGFTNKYYVTWKPQSRKTFDHKRFAEEHKEIDLYPYFKTSSFRKFTVKEIK